MKAQLLDGDLPGTTATYRKMGWTESESFRQWFRQFLSHVKPKKENPVVLVLDGHFSHARNIRLLDLSRENGVHIVCLPPHSTLKMQPFKVSFMLPFKAYNVQQIESWLRMSPAGTVTHYKIAHLLGKTYLKATTVGVAANGFRKAGLFPYNRHIFHESEFLQ